MAAASPRTRPVTCEDALAVPNINSKGLSAGRSGADSCMRRSGMPRYSFACVARVLGGLGWRHMALAVRVCIKTHGCGVAKAMQ